MKKPFPKSAINVLYVLSALFIAVAGVILFLIVKKTFNNDYYGESRNTIFDWWHWALPLVVGVALLLFASYRNMHWYGQVVKDGKVTGHSYSSSLYGDIYYVHVRGVNRVGSTTTERICVQPKAYYDYKVGDKW